MAGIAVARHNEATCETEWVDTETGEVVARVSDLLMRLSPRGTFSALTFKSKREGA